MNEDELVSAWLRFWDPEPRDKAAIDAFFEVEAACMGKDVAAAWGIILKLVRAARTDRELAMI